MILYLYLPHNSIVVSENYIQTIFRLLGGRANRQGPKKVAKGYLSRTAEKLLAEGQSSYSFPQAILPLEGFYFYDKLSRPLKGCGDED